MLEGEHIEVPVAGAAEGVRGNGSGGGGYSGGGGGRVTSGGGDAGRGGSGDGAGASDDFCSKCSGGGVLVCCERCSRAYHFSCVGMHEGEASDEWVCPVCRRNRGSDAAARERALQRLEEVAAAAPR